MKSSDRDFKIVLLGKEFSGKTSLVQRFVNGKFIGEKIYQNTIGAAFQSKDVKIRGKALAIL